MALRKCFSASGKFAAAQMPPAQRIVAARVQRIAPQRFAPVERRAARGVAVLFEMQTGDVKFVGARDVLRRGRFGGGRRHFALSAGLGLVGNEFLPA